MSHIPLVYSALPCCPRLIYRPATTIAIYQNLVHIFVTCADGFPKFSSAANPTLQYATGLQAQVIGKPSEAFFMSAVEQMGVAAENVSQVVLRHIMSLKDYLVSSNNQLEYVIFHETRCSNK